MISLRTRQLALTASIAGLLLAGPALAQTQTVTSQIQTGLNSAAAGYGQTQTDLPTVIGALISSALGLLGALLLAYLLYGGFLWMTAGGDEGKVKKARQLITNAVIGIVIIALAFTIANFILGALTNVTTGGTGTPTG